MANVNAAMSARIAPLPHAWTRAELTRTIIACVITNAALIALWLR